MSRFPTTLILAIALFSLPAKHTAAVEATAIPGAGTTENSPCRAFNKLNTLVRDGRIGREAARRELLRLLPAIGSYYYANGGRDHDRSEWVFPLAGHTARAVAGSRRHGYEPRCYNWYDGNRHGGHPALDIFIRDRNHDDLDDRTGKPVRVLSMTGWIVVAQETEWSPTSRLRGGKYLWIYDPSARRLVYYAHNGTLGVGLGDIVSPGDPIATVGRTGLNAAKRRSPTHLHFSILSIASDGSLAPDDPYPFLLRSTVRDGSKG